MKQSAISVVLLSALGMFIGHNIAVQFDSVILPASASSHSVTTQSFEILDTNGKRRILMASSAEGGPGIWFYDHNGKVRANIGLYADGNSAIVLNDKNEQAVQIFRTVGADSAPVLVMKANGADRIVLGLNGAQSDPFFVTYDRNGTKKSIFGNY